MGLCGGLALFLYGLNQLSDGLKHAAGEALKNLLTRLTTNRFLGALTGALVTGALNSSTITTVLVVSFVTAGLMTLAQSVAVIMGANIGSTVTAQLLAFNLSAYSLLPIAVGFAMLFASKRPAVRHWGMILMGLGLVFYGMGLISDAMRPLRFYAPFVDALARMEKPLYGIIAGAVFTLIVNSSAATVGIAIALASDGLLTLPAGIALALGANIGTCGTALIAALGKPVDAVRAATVHVMFNVIGVVLWFPFIGLLARIAVSISPAADDLTAVLPRQIANANTIFNVLNTIFFIAFTGWFAQIATRLVKDKGPEKALVEPKFLDKTLIEVPAIALENVRQEVARLGDIVRAMLADFPSEQGSTTSNTLDEVSRQGKQVDVLEIAILDFLARIRLGDLAQTESQAHVALTSSAIHFRNIAGIITEDLLDVVRASVSGQIQLGALKRTVLSEFYRSVQLTVELAVKAVHQPSDSIMERAEAISIQIKKFAEELTSQAVTGLETSDQKSLRTLRLQTTLIDGLRQISSLAKRIVIIARA
jgi:phosphate:Na+ symporter